jgi:hypothetical protein
MLQTIINWFTRLWRDDAPDAVERLYLDEYAPYIRERYGIAEPFAHDEEDRTDRWTK